MSPSSKVSFASQSVDYYLHKEVVFAGVGLLDCLSCLRTELRKNYCADTEVNGGL